MNLTQLYKQKNKDAEWFFKHCSLAEKEAGRMFEYTNTNFRTQNAFINAFTKFLTIENKARSLWPKQKDHGQEEHKHYVINMIQSKLFKKSIDELYSKTTKGILFSDFIKLDLAENDKWLINYLFLLNGYYLNRKNYIIHRVKEDLLGYLLSVDGLSEELLVRYSKQLLSTSSLKDALRTPFFFIHSFYDDSDFLIAYLRASNEEREELSNYIDGNLQAASLVCCISKKYQPGGNFNVSMLMDETKVFLLTLLFVLSKDTNLTNIHEIFIKASSQNIFSIDEQYVLKYLENNKNIFDPIFTEVLELEDVEISVSDTVSAREITEATALNLVDKAEDYIDETSLVGKQQIKTLFNIRKKQAREQSDYKCALESINNCQPVYFTAKATQRNYLELHHFIPREFRNDFSYSIEVLANYVTLCPRCHRQIHLAVDRERKHLINSLFEERESRLGVVGLKLNRKAIYDYYKIES